VPRHLIAAPEAACAVNIWDFALPVALGSIAGLVAGMGARKLMDGEHSATKDAIAHVAHAVGFWMVGGITFVLRQRRPHH
jgi:hypothetical protein